jgi:phosphate transport system permease protein
MNALYLARARKDKMIRGLCLGAAAFGLTWLALILFTLFSKGFAGLSPDVFTQMTPPPGSKQAAWPMRFLVPF